MIGSSDNVSFVIKQEAQRGLSVALSHWVTSRQVTVQRVLTTAERIVNP